MLTKKVALITGASRGIGHEIARGLAEDGYNVILIARDEQKLKMLAKQVTDYGIKAHIICEDITHYENINKELANIFKQWGRIDVLVNNAGVFKDGTLETSLDDYQELFYVNFKAQLMILRTVVPLMLQQNKGYIFNIASLAGKTGFAKIGAYASSKFALVGLSESLYQEYTSQGIKITAICPGFVNTDMAKRAPMPTEEMIQPQDILQTIRWLLQLSPHACVKEVILNTT